MRSKKFSKMEASKTKYTGKNPFKRFAFWWKWAENYKRIPLVVLPLLLVAGIGAFAAGNQVVEEKIEQVIQVEEDMEIPEIELSCVDVDGYINIALLGVDSRNMDMEHLTGLNTDCIIVVSMDEKTNEVKMISVYRDTYLKIGDTPTYSKINSAFAYGGAKMAMQSLNQAMDLNISNYVIFNFKMVADLVNAVDGIEVDVKDYEIEQLNKYTSETAHAIGQKKYKKVKEAGYQTLEGVQAVSYGSIRKGVGDDFKRTNRMRYVIKRVTDKLQDKSISELSDIMDICLKQCMTNLSTEDMKGLLMRLPKVHFGRSVGFPFTVSTGYLGNVSYVFPANLYANVIRLHEDIFGQEDYTPTETVSMISNHILGIAGGAGSEPSFSEPGQSQKADDPIVVPDDKKADSQQAEASTGKTDKEDKPSSASSASGDKKKQDKEKGSSSGKKQEGSSTGGKKSESGSTGGKTSGDTGSTGGNTGGNTGGESGNTGGNSGGESGNTGGNSGGDSGNTGGNSGGNIGGNTGGESGGSNSGGGGGESGGSNAGGGGESGGSQEGSGE